MILMPTIEEYFNEINQLKSQIIEIKNQHIELRNQNIELKNQNLELNAKLKYYEEQLKLNKKRMFGSSSEKTEEGYEQINLFNEAEAERQPINIEPTIEEVIVPEHKRKKKRSRKDLIENLPVETIEYELTEAEKICKICETPMHVMSKEVRKELVIIPAQVKVVEHISYVYACRSCEKNATQTPITTAPSPKALIAKSLVSPSLLSHIMCQKFLNAMPLHRQEQDFKRMDIFLSRQTMANWVVCGANLLKPIYDKMKEHLISKQVLHADETTLEVLCEPGRDAIMKSYMWLYKTAKDDKPIVIYDYQQGRSGDFAKRFLNDFNGYLMVDGYSGYRKLEPKVTLSCCWSHVRRKFDEALKVLPEKSPESSAAIGIAFCNKLFDIEREIADKSIEQRKIVRQEQSKAVCEALFSWAEAESFKVLPKTAIGTAIGYLLNLKKYLLTYLEDGRLELSNNSAERSIKPFVIGRKNWLFCNTPAGASSSAIVYSIIETAKENKLKPFEYLKFVFEKIQAREVDIENYLPWDENLPNDLRMKTNEKQ